MSDVPTDSPAAASLHEASVGSGPLERIPCGVLSIVWWCCLGVAFVSLFLPWVTVSSSSSVSGYGGYSASQSLAALWFGLGWLTLLSIGAAVVLRFIRPIRMFAWIGTAAGCLWAIIFAIAPPAAAGSGSYQSSYGGHSASASVDSGVGLGVVLCVIVLLLATAAGLIVFLKAKGAR
jgi:hypothetical protein